VTFDPAKVARSIAGSTAADDYPWLADWVELALEARAGRAQSAMDRSRARSEALRARIRGAVGALPLTEPMSTLVGTVARRMRPEAPSERTIRDELRRMREETRNLGTEATAAQAYALTHRSTE
jgi:hypothetical protein